MTHIDNQQIQRAEQFLWLNARVLERRRFEALFRGADHAPVLQALAAYKNPDGGYGQGIEPDFRGPVSQPLGTLFALGVFDELDLCTQTQVDPVLQHLSGIVAADGGIPNVLANAVEYPRAPWWQPAPSPTPGSLLPTAAIVGLLHKHGLRHPWLERANTFCWQATAQLLERAAHANERLPRLQVAYEARAAITFLDHVPERPRAEQLAATLGQTLLRYKLLATDAHASPEASEAAAPLDFAATPTSLARRWFDDALIAQHLDALIASQNEAGGFDVPWQIWTPITGHEWPGIQTVERLKTLRAYGRFTST